MSGDETYPDGSFCLVDLTTDKLDRAREYYTDVFGWDAKEVRSPDGGSRYFLMTRDHKLVCAIAPRPDALEARSTWNSYVKVSDIVATCARAAKLGANILVEPRSAGAGGDLAIVVAPTGEHFMLWQPRRTRGAELSGDAGGFVWHELYVKHTGRARTFYEALFGWEGRTQHMDGGVDYYTFTNGGEDAGGMIELSGETESMQVGWMVYFAVNDITKHLHRAVKAGARIIADPVSSDNVGTFAMVGDPTGAQYFAIQLDTQA